MSRTPHKSWEMATNNHQLVSMLLRCSKPSRWRQPPKVTRKHAANATTSATRYTNMMQMHLDTLPTHLDEEQSREMSGSGVSKLKGMSSMSNGGREMPQGQPNHLNRRPLKIEPLGSRKGTGRIDRTHCHHPGRWVRSPPAANHKSATSSPL